ncbi:SDR family oxidoreductase [Carboxylicivirga sediminis]|uniref:SDR family oxidoreductase n=1 Tax=Carboxylicivirga sediminis TaxID=2006564 RepID=A0A941IW55_9BACT|nr:SDR family oxidoreductase [Carboxylicivirga sediminis]MBR8535531.1 SDR family oxidoreductase [Carboxylicivirga sediminis]
MEGKIIVVTGASSGIGLQTAIKAQEAGATVIFASRNAKDSKAVKTAIHGSSIAKNLDVGCEKSVKEFFNDIKETYTSIDALVNCAGFVNPESLLNTSLENWNTTLNINLTGTFLTCKHATLLMKRNGGKIINVASTAGLTPRPGWSAYAAAKSGVINFSNAIAEELKDYRIKVFVICPGRTATPLRKILAPNEDPNSIMQPEAVADVVMMCFTKQAEVLEGQPILVRERF